MAALGLHCCAQAFSGCGERGLLFVAVRIAHADFSSCGTQAQLLCNMWDLPRPGIKPVPPALAGRFLTTWDHQGGPKSHALELFLLNVDYI